ncbi:MAG: sulfite exporter TauE/SafE family protein [Steroidobacteraceae bacterium]
MSPAEIVLLAVIGVLSIGFFAQWVLIARRRELRERPTWSDLGIGFLTNFGDALGIGSYATTTALYKFRGRPRDELIPGTLTVGSVSVGIAETIIFVTLIAVDPKLLLVMVASATAGAWLGAGIVSRMRRRSIQLFMGAALLTAAVFFVIGNLGAFPVGGTALSLSGWRFVAAVATNFVLGALSTIGIGWYAPTMVVLALLGFNVRAAFPIMMGSGAMMLPAAGVRFLRSGRFAWGPAVGIATAGVVGAVIAALVVKRLPSHLLRWLVAAVVTYAALAMLRSAQVETAAERVAGSAVKESG